MSTHGEQVVRPKEKELFFQDMANMLTHGYVTTTNDLNETILPYYGYNLSSHAAELMASHLATSALKKLGGQIVRERYLGVMMYYDGKVPEEEMLNMKEVKAEIEARKKDSTLRGMKTRAESLRQEAEARTQRLNH